MRSVLLDTNLLVLLVVGLYDKRLIGNHKRTNTFTVEDFDLLVESIEGYEMLWVTSHCLAEVSNLLKHTHESQAKELLIVLKQFISDKKESHVPKEIIFKNNYFNRLGIADTGIIIKSKRVSCVLTVDFDLYTEIARLGYNVINFNHLRTERLSK
jgi:hypothetical protein